MTRLDNQEQRVCHECGRTFWPRFDESLECSRRCSQLVRERIWRLSSAACHAPVGTRDLDQSSRLVRLPILEARAAAGLPLFPLRADEVDASLPPETKEL